MTPLKNGVILWSDEYQNYHRADVYKLEGYGWLFRVNNIPCSACELDDADFQIREIDEWFDQNGREHGTMLVKELNADSDVFEARQQETAS